MEATDELALIAELGVAFAGFVAIFLIFARREGRFSPADSLRIRSIILASFCAVFMALIPLVLKHFGLHGVALWRASSALAFLGGGVASWDIARKQLGMSAEDRGEVGSLHTAVSWGLTGIATLLYASNLSGIPSEPSAGPYIAALVCILGVSASNFVTIAFQRLL